ncbi:hypothetical protein V1278_002577 [Bradyrhizobium sp. AZCC 1577]
MPVKTLLPRLLFPKRHHRSFASPLGAGTNSNMLRLGGRGLGHSTMVRRQNAGWRHWSLPTVGAYGAACVFLHSTITRCQWASAALVLPNSRRSSPRQIPVDTTFLQKRFSPRLKSVRASLQRSQAYRRPSVTPPIPCGQHQLNFRLCRRFSVVLPSRLSGALSNTSWCSLMLILLRSGLSLLVRLSVIKLPCYRLS